MVRVLEVSSASSGKPRKTDALAEAPEVAILIIWINGAFGAGKTAPAWQLAQAAAASNAATADSASSPTGSRAGSAGMPARRPSDS